MDRPGCNHAVAAVGRIAGRTAADLPGRLDRAGSHRAAARRTLPAAGTAPVRRRELMERRSPDAVAGIRRSRFPAPAGGTRLADRSPAADCGLVGCTPAGRSCRLDCSRRSLTF